MKKHLLSLAAIIGLSLSSFAQMGPVSLGLEVALPMGDFADGYSLGFGASAGYEHPVGDNIGITAQIGYIILSPADGFKDIVDKASMMPIQAGLKYYFMEQNNGFYGHAQIGIHNVSITTKEYENSGNTFPSASDSDSQLSFAIGAGYVVNSKIDVGVRLNVITADSEIEGAESSNYLGFRIAYNLFGGE